MKRQQKIVMEVRDRSSVGHPTSIGARVEAQFPHDIYKIRKLLDRDNEWRNLMLWQAVERLRQDFEAWPSGQDSPASPRSGGWRRSYAR